MALTPTEEAQTRALLAQQAELLTLACSEPAIMSSLGATDVNLSQLPSAGSVADADILLLRQGSTDKSVAGSTLKSYAQPSAASDTVSGIVELATVAEAQAMSDAVRALSPARLASAFGGANQSLAASGYQKLPSGLIIQWGQTSYTTTTTVTLVSVSLPIAFPNARLFGIISPTDISVSSTGSSSRYSPTGALSVFQFYQSASSDFATSAFWTAIGY